MNDLPDQARTLNRKIDGAVSAFAATLATAQARHALTGARVVAYRAEADRRARVGVRVGSGDAPALALQAEVVAALAVDSTVQLQQVATLAALLADAQALLAQMADALELEPVQHATRLDAICARLRADGSMPPAA